MNTSTLVQKVWSFCHTLRTAFASQPVRQDPNDELASARLACAAVKKPRGRQAKEAT